MGILVDLYFFEAGCQKKGLSFSWGGCDFHRNQGMVVILFYFLCNYDNMTLKRCYTDEGWLFIGRFKVVSVPGMSVTLEASKKCIKIHH